MRERLYKIFRAVSLEKYKELEHKYNTLKFRNERLEKDYCELLDKPDMQADTIERLEKRITELERTQSMLIRGLGIEEYSNVLVSVAEKEEKKSKRVKKEKIKGGEQYE